MSTMTLSAKCQVVLPAALCRQGLDRCPDHGADGFERYIALAMVGRNIHRLGAILIAREAEAERRRRRQLKRAA